MLRIFAEEMMKSLLVKLNGRRIRVAGANSDNWRVVGLVELLHQDGEYSLQLDVSTIDNIKALGHSWPIQELQLGDVITMEVCEGVPLDSPEINVHLPEGLFANLAEVAPETGTTESK